MNTQERIPGAEKGTLGVDKSHGLGVTQPCEELDSGVTSRDLFGDRYRVVGEIARGGMGVVLRAYDASFQRPLAIKVLLRRAREEIGTERRFLEEARITGQLQHPGIPPVHELG